MSLPAIEQRAHPSELDDVVYHISHDLRASVRALRELPAWLAEDLDEVGIKLHGETEDTLALIQSHARRLDEMLDGLLSYSRVGRLQEVVTVQPQEVFSRVLAELNPGAQAAFFTQFNAVTVRMGASDIARIFHVLLSNALAHTGPLPKIEVTSCKSGNVWELLVADNGPGIPDSEKANILKPMAKLVSRDQDEGGGMGLAILQKIVEHYGGTLHVEDRVRRGGATFRLRLPVLING